MTCGSRNKLWIAVVIAFGVLFPWVGMSWAGGLQASFQGARDVCDGSLVRPSALAAYCGGRVDGNGDWFDLSGHNFLTDRVEIDDWTENGTCAVTADQYRNPVDGALDADLLDNTGGANTDFRFQYSASISTNPHTGSIWVRVDTPHNVTLTIYEQGVGIVDEIVFAATYQWTRIDAGDAGTGVGAIGIGLYPGERGVSTGQAYFYGAQLVECNQSPCQRGRFINPPDQSVTKPAFDLAPTGTPSRAVGDFQGVDGNRVEARSLNGTTDFYSTAHHDSMDINEGDHTYTFVTKLDSSATAYNTLVAHYNINVCGIFFAANVTAGEWIFIYYNVGGSVEVTNSAIPNDGKYHVVQLVRESNIAVLYVDDVPGSPMDVTGYGLDCPRALSVGGVTGGFHLYEGDDFYISVVAVALSSDELAYEREILLGIATSQTTVPKSNEEEDGTMEDPGVGDWPGYNDAAPSKTTDDPHSGTRALRITYDGTANPGVYQAVLEIGTRYRMIGFARGDGTWSPGAGYDSTLMWTGTFSTAWQMFDFTFRPTANNFFLGTNATGAGHVDYDDVTVIVYNDDIIDFSRYTTAYTTFADGTMAEVAWNIPRVGGDGGEFLIEGQDNSICLQSKTFDFLPWTRVGLATVIPDGSTAPDGTTDMDGPVATALDVSHGLSQVVNILFVVPHTFSVYAKPGDQDWIYMANTTVANATAYFNLANGYVGMIGAGATAKMESLAYGVWRCWITYTATGEPNTHVIYSAEADGDNVFVGDAVTANTWLWQAQVEVGSFPSSPITTTNISVTRTKDCADYDIHPDNGTDWMLPMSFGPTGNATAFTMYGEWKGMWSGASDIGATRRLVDIGSDETVNNDMELYVHTDGKAYLSFTDSGGTVHTINSTAHTTYDEWFTVRAVVDFVDLSNSELWINGTVDHDADSNMTGNAIWDTEECQLNLGSDRTETVDGYNWHKDLHITPEEIRAP